MSTHNAFERLIADSMAGDTRGDAPDRVLNQILTTTSRVRPQPRWLALIKEPPMRLSSRVAVGSPTFRLASIAALTMALILALGAAVAVGASLLPSPAPRLPAPYGPAGNGSIVYDATGDIYLADATGANATVLVGGSTVDCCAGFSRDGTRIAFMRDGDGTTSDLMVARADGTGAVQVASNTDNYDWSPDGSQLVAHQVVSGKPKLSIVRADGTGTPTTLDLGGVEPLDFVAWRPVDGAEILFIGSPQAGSPQVGLYGISPDGTGERAIGAISTSESARSNPADHLSLQAPVLSPDGTTILYGNWEADGAGVMGSYLHERDLTTGQDRRFTFDDHSTSLGTVPVFSPDGKSFIVTAVSKKTAGMAQLVVASADGSLPAVAVGPEYSYQDRQGYSFSPDGTKVLLDLNPGLSYILDVTGGSGTPLKQYLPNYPSWQRRAP
jgi:hypothetical protein